MSCPKKNIKDNALGIRNMKSKRKEWNAKQTKSRSPIVTKRLINT